jgi:Putative MetA-pathway of phenol degradation
LELSIATTAFTLIELGFWRTPQWRLSAANVLRHHASSVGCAIGRSRGSVSHDQVLVECLKRFIAIAACVCGFYAKQALIDITVSGAVDPCPTNVAEIATDRPDVTNSSLVVPYGSLQAENGIDWTIKYGSNVLDGTNTRVRLGIAHCTEFLIDVPSYFLSINSSQPSGSSDVVVSFKRQLPVPLGFDLSATAGLGFPSGSSNISGHGYQPYVQFPWSHKLADDWEAVGMFTLTWFSERIDTKSDL